MAEGRTLGMGELERVEHRPSVLAPFSAGLIEAQRRQANIVLLTADLGKYTDVSAFRETYPDRFYNVGMAEQALVTIAAGLARSGHVAYCTTYGCFATRRAYDFLAIACAHGAADVKMFAALPGLTTGYGGTHQAIEDLALMRSIPDLTVIDPCDATEMEQVTTAAATIPGAVYCRLLRGTVPRVLDPATYRFSPGKAIRLRSGTDVGFISTGIMTERALDAAAALESESIRAGVLHVPTIKPFDSEAVASFVSDYSAIVIAENHVAIGGLTSLVFDTMVTSGLSRPVLKIAIPDKFIECGSVPYLQDRYGLSTQRVIEQARAWLRQRSAASRTSEFSA